MTSDAVQTFVAWGLGNLPALLGKADDEAAGSIGGELLEVHPGLGVEVSGAVQGEDRELIVTAFSDPVLFPLVRRIVNLVSGVPGWKVIALKPPRGFEFTITLGEKRLKAGTLQFAPIPTIAGGVRLLVERDCLLRMTDDEENQELAWLIVETGIGEELSS